MYYLNLDWLKEKPGSLCWSLRIHGWTDPADPAASYVTARKLQTQLHSDASRHQIQKWLAECANHTQCSKQTEVILPTRVIEVAPAIGKPRVLNTAGKKGRYVTLSYCWGGSSHGELIQSNLNEYIQSLKVDALPQTIRDAIEVTKSIAVPYLWVDALCIIQDSDDDKRHEIAMMQQIYKESFITIVAACSEHVGQGFLHTRPIPLELYTIPFRLAESLFGTMSVQDLDEIEYDESSEPINKRAWTLQESLLPCRYLIYSSHTLQWRCKSGVQNFGNSLHIVSYAERNQYSQSLYTLSTQDFDAEQALKRWLRLVTIYSQRSVSLPHDKLNAISAVATEFSSLLGSYIAGVWQLSLLWQLTWVTSSSWNPRAGNTRPKVYRAPSWSWASVDGDLSFEDNLLEADNEEYLYRCNVISCETESKSVQFPFGEVLSGSLKLRGVLKQALFKSATKELVWFTEDDPLSKSKNCHRSPKHAENECDESEGASDLYIGAKGYHDEAGDWPPILVFCFPISAQGKRISKGLLLVELEGDIFKRVGSFEAADKEYFDHLTQREITII
ncbi:heterokaryon incompatibility protein-domain-containing protein [Xylogone sp. PMI_703]|nr:heterokaryon incompatibility protein-domain-containing protein [Xylogone sp. PMI_703]